MIPTRRRCSLASRSTPSVDFKNGADAGRMPASFSRNQIQPASTAVPTPPRHERERVRSFAPAWRPAGAVFNPWIVALAVVVPTFMEVLDTTIANVALRYIAGGFPRRSTDSEWVITSYLAANAIILPISGWLAAHFGRRRYFLLSIAVFTIAPSCAAWRRVSNH